MDRDNNPGSRFGVVLVIGGGLVGYLLFQKIYVETMGVLPSNLLTAGAAIVVGFVGATLLRRGGPH